MPRIVKTKVMLKTVEDEGSKQLFIDNESYKRVFKRAHKDIQMMTLDNNVHKGSFFMSRRKLKIKVKSIMVKESALERSEAASEIVQE